MTEYPEATSVVVGVDGSEPSHRAVEWAAGEAFRRGAPLRVVHGFPDDPSVAVGRDPQIRAAAQDLAEAAAERARKVTGDAVPVRATIADGPPAKALVEESERSALLVVGSRGHGGFADLLIGSTSVHVAAHAACPVAVVPRHEATSGAGDGSVLAGVDGGRVSEQALQFAFERANDRGAGLVALHVWHVPVDYGAYPVVPARGDSERAEHDARTRLADAVAPWQQRYPQVVAEQPRPGACLDVLAALKGR